MAESGKYFITPVHIETIKINKFDIGNSVTTKNLLDISPTK